MPRRHVFLAAVLSQFGSDQTSTHRIKDLSATGARIDRASAIQLNSTVLVSVGALEAVGATVVWKEGDVAGLKFFEPIDPEAAQAKTIVPVRPSPVAASGTGAGQAGEGKAGATAGWVRDLRNPYRR